ncbi:MAG TPA: GNAT family N-acetyltransferase [Candidatus Acidoferrales bacterium]|nr:GNAT family N-acetyltransferase [Candidatus Acidoferrales bacterium]
MDNLIERGDLAFRLMRDDLLDYRLMSKWLTDPRVLEFYDGRDNPLPLKQAAEKYSPRILSSEGVTPCFLLYRGTAIGYLQYDPVTEEVRASYDLGDSDVDGTYSMDLFIGETGYWGQGIGTQAVSLFLEYLFGIRAARKVVIDPHVDNFRAIRCYEKCGFRRVKILSKHELHEGEYRDSCLMELDVKAWRG